jgi:hypothetical protein
MPDRKQSQWINAVRLQKSTISGHVCHTPVKQRQHLGFGIDGLIDQQQFVQWFFHEMPENVSR